LEDDDLNISLTVINMKKIFTCFLIFWISQEVNAQVNLDERKFAIILSLEGERQYSDSLFFTNGNLFFSTAKKYGFAPAPYRAREKKNLSIEGTATNESKMNGIMHWNFQIMNDSIYGEATLDTRLQNPVKHNFTGKEIKLP
jgi:hypothetical protein